jgi:hypothetical protein
MPSAGFEPKIPATKRPQICALGNKVTGIGYTEFSIYFFIVYFTTLWQ